MPDRKPNHRTMRINPRVCRHTVDKLEIEARKTSGSVHPDRRSERLRFDAGMIFVHLRDTHNNTHDYAAVPRNLSTRGLAFVHTHFMHPHSRCELTLPQLDGNWTRVGGRIVRCRHIEGVMHELAIAFDEPVDVTQLTQADEDKRESLRAEYKQLLAEELQKREAEQTILVVTVNEDRRQIWTDSLGDSLAMLHVVTTLDEARKHVQSPKVSACIIDCMPTALGTSRVVAAVRKINSDLPVVALLEEASDEDGALLKAHGASACVSADVNRDELMMLIIQQCDMLAAQRRSA